MPVLAQRRDVLQTAHHDSREVALEADMQLGHIDERRDQKERVKLICT